MIHSRDVDVAKSVRNRTSDLRALPQALRSTYSAKHDPEFVLHLDPRNPILPATVPHSQPNTKMDFAPYQDSSPETHRALSPPPNEGRRSFSPGIRSPPLVSPNGTRPSANPWEPVSSSSIAHNSSSAFGNDGTDLEGGREGRLNEFETSLPIRLDYEACLAYLLLPPAGGVLLLVLEQKSDYVR